MGKVNVAGCTGEDAEDEAGKDVDGAVETETEKVCSGKGRKAKDATDYTKVNDLVSTFLGESMKFIQVKERVNALFLLET